VFKALHAYVRLTIPVLLMALAGCSTIAPSGVRIGGDSVSVAATNTVEALARYSCGLIAQADVAVAYAAGRKGDAERCGAQALQHFETAAKLDRRQMALSMQLAWLYVDDYKMFTEAIELLKDCRQRDSSNPDVAILLGYAYQQLQQPDAALREYRRALVLKPDAERVYNRAALILMQQHKQREALDLLQRGLYRVRDPQEILLFLDLQGRIAMGANQYGSAIRCFEMIAGVQTNNLTVRELLGALYTADDQPTKAVALLTPLMRAESGAALPGLQYRLGDAWAQKKDWTQAERYWRLACAGSPPRHEPFLSLGAYLLNGRAAEAEKVMRQGLERLPDHPSFLTFLGLLYVRQNDFSNAVPEFARAVAALKAFAPDKRPAAIPMLYHWYGMALERCGRFAEAEKIFEEHVAALPDMHESLNYLAYVWAERGTNLARAREYAGRALAKEPDNPAYLDTLGWIYYRQQDYTNAEYYLRRAHIALRDDPTIREHLGDVLAAQQQVAAAVSHWRAAFMTDPRNKALADKLSKAGVDVEKLLRTIHPPIPTGGNTPARGGT